MTELKHDQVAFKEAYSVLNITQKKAVDTIEGPVMVVAGPGTGKTQILTLRIANILLKTDTQPSSILALTFTESGAKAMRERLRRYIGATAYQVPIFTFHGFAQKLISDYPDAYNRVIGGRPASDLEKINLIESILEGGSIKILRPMGSPTYYVTHILRIIGKLKQEYITPDEFAQLLAEQEQDLDDTEKIHEKGAHKGKVRGEYTKKEKSLNKNKELLVVYKQYEQLLSDQNLYDFEDMIVETVKALSNNEDMLRDLQENYQYILADEHQDVNGSQNKILELLASFHDSPNIFAVGDEKQAIYRFQGASLENFLYFTEQYPGTKVISLTDNYRSGQSILDAAHNLVEVEEGPLKDLRLKLKSKNINQSVVEAREFSHQAVEDTWLVDTVAKKLSEGSVASEIAIIVRTNREVESLATLLRKANIPATASADGDILRHPITQSIQMLIEAVVSGDSSKALFSVLHGAYWNINTNDLVKVLSAQSYKESLWEIVSNEEKLHDLGLSNIEPVQRVATVIVEARKLEVRESPHRVLEYVLQQSGFLDYIVKVDPLEGTRVVRRLYDEIEELVLRGDVSSLRDVQTALATRLSYGLALNAPYISTNPDSVQVMTAHKSKGLEFETVFIPHLTDNCWGGSAKRTYFDIQLHLQAPGVPHELVEDERRLLYVAMTRAKVSLHLSSSDINTEGRELLPTRLMSEIDENLILFCDTEKEDKSFNPIADLLKPTKSLAIDSVLLKSLLEQRGFSATSLNNYLSSPWNYFYRNILRIPEIQAVHMQYGTAIHNTLEQVTKLHTKNGTLPSFTDIKKKFETELGRLPIHVTEYTRLLEKGLEDLTVYCDHLQKTLPKNTLEELSIKVTLETGLAEFPEITLTGKLDRLDLDDNGQAVRVVDYKTGKPKTRNVIEGKTKDSDGGYKRQLVFYALLLSLYDDDRYVCSNGTLSFVQASSKGEITEESFSITTTEIEDLKQEIIASVKEIISGEFLTSECNEKLSDYCHLVQALQSGLDG